MSQPRPPAPPFDLRLIDFGNAVYTAETMPGETAGTPSYLAPEARGGRAWGPAVDVWAVGCILYEIVAGCRVGENNVDCRDGKAGGAGVGGLMDPRGGVLEGMVELVKRLLSDDAEERPSARDALQDPVFSLGA